MTEPVEEYAEAPLPAALRPFVASMVGYRLAGFPPGVHVGMPSRHLTVILALDSGIRVSGNGIGNEPRRFGALLGGLHTSPAHVHHDGTQFGVQLALTPLGSRALLRAPAAAFASGLVEMDDALGGVGDRLRELLALSDGWPRRFDLLSRELLALIDDRRSVDAPSAAAWAMLAGSRGRMPVAAVAEAVGWSRRHLTTRFAREFGPTPKLAGRVLRFEHSRELLGRIPLADIAIRCGYADQSHLVRDWREFAGASPTQWLRDDALARVGDTPAA